MLNPFIKELRILSIIALFFLANPMSCAVEIAVTLDDHPMSEGGLFSADERVERYCSALEKYACHAAFFCVGSACQNTANSSCLTRLNDMGHFLANHSFFHRPLSLISLDEFQNEIMATEVILHPFSQFRKWFRFPYLDYGDRVQMGGSKEKFLAAIDVLKAAEYRDGFVTINTFDWHIEACLQTAIHENKEIDYPRLKEAYLHLLKEWCNHYITSYKKLPSQEITHVLLLHANDLNALFLEDILEMVEENGWEIVSPEQAFADSSWREIFLTQPELAPDKPASLNKESIDQVLESYHVFAGQ